VSFVFFVPLWFVAVAVPTKEQIRGIVILLGLALLWTLWRLWTLPS